MKIIEHRREQLVRTGENSCSVGSPACKEKIVSGLQQNQEPEAWWTTGENSCSVGSETPACKQKIVYGLQQNQEPEAWWTTGNAVLIIYGLRMLSRSCRDYRIFILMYLYIKKNKIIILKFLKWK